MRLSRFLLSMGGKMEYGMPLPKQFYDRLMAMKPGDVLRGAPIQIPLGDPGEGCHWEAVDPPTMRGAWAEFRAVPNESLPLKSLEPSPGSSGESPHSSTS